LRAVDGLHLSVIAALISNKQNLRQPQNEIEMRLVTRPVADFAAPDAPCHPPFDWRCCETMSSRRAMIIGGGIGGLAAAIALEQAGWHVEVFEQASELREVGAGLTIWTNGVVALRGLGLEDEVLALAAINHRTEVRSWRGDLLAAASLDDMSRQLGAPSITMLRGDLLAALASCVDANAIHLNARLVEMVEHDDGVTARFADGSQHRGEVLIGADGLHSAVRALRFGPEPLRYAGYTCWRGMITDPAAELEIPCGFESWGRGARFAVQPCGRKRLFWYATQNAPADQSDTWQGRKRDVERRFRAWHDPIPAVIEATDSARFLRNDIVDRPPRGGWSQGRATLLGDAAHPTTPNFGQGACQAMEDAIVLAAVLAKTTDIEASLKRYERLRYRRTAWITRSSWRMGRTLQRESLLANFVRDTATRSGLFTLPLTWQLRRMLSFFPPT
jgi:2-polyprenyl-6-methoxyphenol hydroxylase-like FAD-dependent oxidoreductase